MHKLIRFCLFSFILLFPTVSTSAQELPHYQDVMRVGRGALADLAWHPQTNVLAVSSTTGIWLYTDTLEDTGHLEIADAGYLQWSANGENLLVQMGHYDLETGWSYHWQAWAVHDGQFEPLLDEYTQINALAWNHPQTRLALIASEGFFVLDAATYQSLLHIPGGKVAGFNWSADGESLALLIDGQIQIRDSVTLEPRVTLTGEEHGLVSIWWSPDSTMIAAKTGGNVLRDADAGQVLVWDVNTGQRIAALQSEEIPYDAEGGDPATIREIIGDDALWSVDSQILDLNHSDPSASYRSTIRLWDIQTQAAIESLPTTFLLKMEWTSDGENLLVRAVGGSGYPYADLIQLATNELTEMFVVGMSWKVSPDNRMIATYGYNASAVRLFDMQSLELLAEFDGHTSRIRDVEWNYNSSKIAAFSAGEIQLWDVQSGVMLANTLLYLGEQGRVSGWNSDGSLLALSNDDPGPLHVYENANVRIWNMEIVQPAQVLRGHNLWATATWEPDGRRIVTSSFTGDPRVSADTRIWDAQTGDVLVTLTPPGDATWDSYGLEIAVRASVDAKPAITIAYAFTGKQRLIIEDTPYLYSLLWHPYADMLLGVSQPSDSNPILHFWDVDSGKELASVELSSRTIALSPDGTQLAVISDQNTISVGVLSRIGDAVLYNKAVTTLHLPFTKRVQGIYWHPGGQKLAVLSDSFELENYLYLWDIAAPDSPQMLLSGKIQDHNRITSFAWHPDGTMFATSQENGIVRIWQEDAD